MIELFRLFWAIATSGLPTPGNRQ